MPLLHAHKDLMKYLIFKKILCTKLKSVYMLCCSKILKILLRFQENGSI